MAAVVAVRLYYINIVEILGLRQARVISQNATDIIARSRARLINTYFAALGTQYIFSHPLTWFTNNFWFTHNLCA